MEYRIHEDLKLIRETLGLSQRDIAPLLELSVPTIARIESKANVPSEDTIRKIYDFAYARGIRINRLKEMFYKEDESNRKILFHGSKIGIEGNISPCFGRANNDFGSGFYCGESSEQAISFIAKYPHSSLYMLSFDDAGLTKTRFVVDREWMLAVAYFRGTLKKYKDHPKIQRIVEKVKNADYISAPIADNRMFMIIDQFIDGYITDEQCKHCLAATNLGNQYVFLTEKATSHLTLLEKCYLCSAEREHYSRIKEAETLDGDNKVKMALAKYKREGLYIEEILK